MIIEDNSWLDYTKSQAYIKEVLQYTSEGDAIDIGCWTGRNTFFLEENGFNVAAVDNDQENQRKELTNTSLCIRHIKHS